MNIDFRFGTWGSDNIGKSSNYRELKNLVETIEIMHRKEELDGVELFIFTDNSVAERAFYKGSSSSKELFELILRLKRIEVGCAMRLHSVHIAGTRMILQGVDKLSRGNLIEGVMG